MHHQRIVAHQPEIRTSAEAARMLGGTFRGLRREEMRILYLDACFRVLEASSVGGEEMQVTMPLRRIVHEALLIRAAALIVAHNHPGGDPAPSRADRMATRRLVEVAQPLRIELLDHLIFADDRWFSFRAAGLI